MTIIQKQIFVYILGGDYDKFLEALTEDEREAVMLSDHYYDNVTK